jgi:hypothetical protein
MIAREHADQTRHAARASRAARTPSENARSPSENARSPSEQEWLRVNAYLRRNRHELAVRAAGCYPPGARVAGTPLLAAPAWRPAAPVPLAGIRLEFRPQAPPPAVPDAAAVAPDLLPRRGDGSRYDRYSQVVGSLAAPAIFENRTIYRLTEADLAGAGPHLTFTRGRFFDAVDVGGLAGHEYAAARLGPRADLKLRAAIGDPCDLGARPAAMAIAALTLRHDRATGSASFPLHWRDPARVGHAGGMYQVIPVGIFQPSGEAPWNEANDFDLWRGMLREFAEELLGAGEDHGSEAAPIDYGRWPLANQMTGALRDGRIRAYCLGLGADPLTFALDLLTAVVIDAPLYDDLFGAAVSGNAEGTVLSPRPFDEPSVTGLIARYPVQAAGAALLTLAIRHRRTLLGGLPAGRAAACPPGYQPSGVPFPPPVGRPGYQPRSRHSARCGRSAPSVVSFPCPGYTQVASGSRPKIFATTPLYSEVKRSGSCCVLPTPPGNRQSPVNRCGSGPSGR